MLLYLIVDIREEGANGQSEGVLSLVGKPEGKDIPGSRIGNHLILNVVRFIAFTSFVLNLHTY